MKCPNCKEDENVVTDTRGTRRTRRCKVCDQTFVTSEGYDVGNIWVLKRDGAKQQFSREQLYDSIQKARVRSIPVAEIQDLVDRTIAELFSKETLFFPSVEGTEWTDTTTVTTRQIGNAVMDVLHARTRYRATRIRYALLFESSNKAFANAEEFARWLTKNNRLPTDEPADVPITVVKRSGEPHDYEREKFAESIKFAIRKKPVSDRADKRDNEALVDAIVRAVEKRLRGQRTVTSAQLALETMNVLRDAEEGSDLDRLMGRDERELAYLRVASSAKHFTQIRDFYSEAMHLATPRSDHKRRIGD